MTVFLWSRHREKAKDDGQIKTDEAQGSQAGLRSVAVQEHGQELQQCRRQRVDTIQVRKGEDRQEGRFRRIEDLAGRQDDQADQQRSRVRTIAKTAWLATQARHLKLEMRDMVRTSFVIGVVLLIAFLSASARAGMPIPPETKKCVGFIFRKDSAGRDIPIGTGFYVATQSPDKKQQHGYLVTAKHVLQSGATGRTYLAEVIVRLNRKGGGTETCEIPLQTEGREKNVFFHKDASVDVCVIPLPYDFSSLDVIFLPTSWVTSKQQFEQLKISEGSDVFFVGMFTPHLGKSKNYPVARFGRVALLSDEKIDFGGEPQDLYLIETFSFGGNSGSPVFFYLGSDRDPGALIVSRPIVKLAGIMTGAFSKTLSIVKDQKIAGQIPLNNMGIAAVTPAYTLWEVIFSDELKGFRGY